MGKITIDLIQRTLAPENWKVLSKEYKNLDSELIFECDEGHQVYSTWKKIRAKRECPVCKQNKFKEIETIIIPKKTNEYRVLALDQATYISGWAIFSNGKLLQYGTFESNLKDEIERDNTIKNWLINLIKNWGIDFVALEGIQYEQNFGVTVFATLARLQGILMSVLLEQNIQYIICPPSKWRSYCEVKGKTRSDKKRSMQLRVKEWYDITVSDDCADAIGIGHYAVSKTNKPKIEIWE